MLRPLNIDAKSAENLSKFKDRLLIAKKGDTVYSFAKKCGFTESLIRKYLAGDSLPGLDKLVLIANTAGVSIEWLATGDGPMRKDEAPPSPALTAVTVPPLKKEILLEIIEALEMFLTNNHLKMPPEKKAKFIVMAYELWQNEQDKKAAKSRIQQLFNLAA